MPLDMLCYARGSLKSERRARINADNAYFKNLRESWGERIRQAFAELPGLDWPGLSGR
jgi:putative proteasome-type protease